MPTTVSELFAAANVRWMGSVAWRQPVPLNSGGVYVVSLAGTPESHPRLWARAPIDNNRVSEWLERVPELTIDGIASPSSLALVQRLSTFWLPDENVIYVGKATNLRRRVGEYYRTRLGDRRPHAGGHWIKTLAVLPRTFVHYGESKDPAASEALMLGRFVHGVSEETRQELGDPERPFPFANLEFPRVRKRHGLSKTTR